MTLTKRRRRRNEESLLVHARSKAFLRPPSDQMAKTARTAETAADTTRLCQPTETNVKKGDELPSVQACNEG